LILVAARSLRASVQNLPMDPGLLPMYEQLTTAFDAFARGDAEPYKVLWEHTENVSVLGAFGGRNLGWSEVGPRLDLAVSQYRDGRYDDLEVLASGAGGDMAYIVWLETISDASAGGEAVTRRRRITHVLRRQGDDWRIVHQHGDPLVDLVPPS
jgi:ketosteroid isomerase-like protein